MTVKIKIWDILFITAIFISIIPIVYSIYTMQYLNIILYSSLAVSIAIGYMIYGRRRMFRKGIDESLVLAVTHMYCMSTAIPDPKHIIGVVADTRDYGYYQDVMIRVREIALKWGYGFSDALKTVSKQVGDPLKSFLRRGTEIFSASNIPRYLKAEHITMLDEFERDYSRRIEGIKLLAGAYTAILTSSVFAVVTIVLLAVFYSSNMMMILLIAGAILAIIAMYLAVRSSMPRETFMWIDSRYMPRQYMIYRTVLYATIPMSIALASAGYLIYGYAGSMALAGAGLIPAGALAYRLENMIRDADDHYPTFIKTIGENFTANPSMLSTLELMSDLELGRIKDALARLSRRIKAGVDGDKSIDIFASELMSNLIHKLTRIFFDSIRAGGKAIDISETINVTASRINHLRKNRAAMSDSFSIILVILQPIVVTLLTIMLGLTGLFNQYLVSIPYFPLYPIPIDLLTIGSLLFAVSSSVVNALTMYSIRGGVRGTVLLYTGLMLILSAGGWILGYMVISRLLIPLSAPVP